MEASRLAEDSVYAQSWSPDTRHSTGSLHDSVHGRKGRCRRWAVTTSGHDFPVAPTAFSPSGGWGGVRREELLGLSGVRSVLLWGPRRCPGGEEGLSFGPSRILGPVCPGFCHRVEGGWLVSTALTVSEESRRETAEVWGARSSGLTPCVRVSGHRKAGPWDRAGSEHMAGAAGL